MKRTAAVLLTFVFSLSLSAAPSRIDVTKEAREAVARGKIAAFAEAVIGADYWPGGADDEYGYDCSGLTQKAYFEAGIKIPRKSTEQYRLSKKLGVAGMKKGDLVFFNTRGLGPTHVGIYIGKRKFIHAPGIGKNIRYDSLDSKYWGPRFVGAGRYI